MVQRITQPGFLQVKAWGNGQDLVALRIGSVVGTQAGHHIGQRVPQVVRVTGVGLQVVEVPCAIAHGGDIADQLVTTLVQRRAAG